MESPNIDETKSDQSEIKTSKKICNVIEINDVEYHQIILGKKFKIKILNVNSDEIQRWKGNAYARTFYKEKLKQLITRCREQAKKETYDECDRLGIVHDKITQGRKHKDDKDIEIQIHKIKN